MPKEMVLLARFVVRSFWGVCNQSTQATNIQTNHMCTQTHTHIYTLHAYIYTPTEYRPQNKCIPDVSCLHLTLNPFHGLCVVILILTLILPALIFIRRFSFHFIFFCSSPERKREKAKASLASYAIVFAGYLSLQVNLHM